MVFQAYTLFPWLTVRRNVEYGLRRKRMPEAERRKIVDHYLLEVGLTGFADHFPKQLSGGMMQRVAIARALANDPDILLMDEPFGAVDAVTRSSLQVEFQAIQARTHKTVLFVTHDVEEALRLAGRLVVMDAGQVVQCDTPFNVLARPASRFVAELVGAGDLTRRLRLVTVAEALRPLQPGAAASGLTASGVAASGLAPLGLDDTLRDALSRLLQTGVDALPVADAEGRLVGQVDLEGVRERLRPAPAGAPLGDGEPS
jgi:ABC-type proline/glycine betaine transport system ATPase subunit